jgi:hypothetical protein
VLLVTAGHAGELAGAAMLAGGIFILGRAGANPGLNMRRGSIVADSLDGEPPVGFLYSGFGDTVWLRVFLRSIANLGFSLPPGWWQDRWCRYSGDHLGLGKGELYTHDPVE